MPEKIPTHEVHTEDPAKPEGPSQTNERGNLDSTDEPKEPKIAIERRLLALEQRIAKSERVALGYRQYVRDMRRRGKKPMNQSQWRKQRGCPVPEEDAPFAGRGRHRRTGPDPTHHYPGPWGPYGFPGPGDSP